MSLDTKIQANIGCDVPFDVKYMHDFGENSLDEKLTPYHGRLDNDGTCLTLSYARLDDPIYMNTEENKNLTLELNVDSYCVRITLISRTNSLNSHSHVLVIRGQLIVFHQVINPARTFSYCNSSPRRLSGLFLL